MVRPLGLDRVCPDLEAAHLGDHVFGQESDSLQVVAIDEGDEVLQAGADEALEVGDEYQDAFGPYRSPAD